ncbi:MULTISPECIES: DUF4339 domain-containing protein [unclassified Microcoleus]|uniref:DUF4339 domain-containing protein n=1 Tax=unclassified Microcoleus TaxID=2642155 RepID=UPI002FCFFFAA
MRAFWPNPYSPQQLYQVLTVQFKCRTAYVFRSGEAKGPYTKLQLWEVQEITARTKVRRGEAEWQRAGEIPELASYLT